MAFRFDQITGRTLIEVGPKAVPTSATDELTEDCAVFEIEITNPTSSDITVYVKDRQATPIYILPTMVVPANGGVVTYTSTMGRKCPSGITWQAGGAGLHGYIQTGQV